MKDPSRHRHRWRTTIHNGATHRWGAKLCACGARIELGPADVAKLLERRRSRREHKARGTPEAT